MPQKAWVLVSDDLIISGGGSTEVATSALLSQQRHLERLAEELNVCRSRLRSIDGRVSRARMRAADAPLSAMRAERAMAEAQDALHSSRERASTLARGIADAATAYGNAEAAVDGWARQLSATIAYQLGFWSPVAGVLALPILFPIALTAAGAAGGGWLMTPEARREKTMNEWVQANKGILSDPRFVSFVRLAVSSADDFGEGLVHLPEPLAQLLGDDGLGILGVGSSAAVAVGVAGAAGALRETPVTTTLSSTRVGAPPAIGLAERARRIPTGHDQIRIDRYSQPDGPDHFEVYLGGTIDGSVVSSTEPWDMTSNLNAVAGADSGSMVAARQAMQQAGIDSTTPVVFTGYSQGGLLSAQLAASGDFDTRGLVTFGGPAGGVSVPHDIPYVALEHADDLVPATGGVWKSSDPVLVTLTVYGDHPYSGDIFFPAHELSNYRQTASLADASDEQRLADSRDALRHFTEGTTEVQSSYFHAVRTGG
ncbi:hypothetical protein [Parafrigoribacterium soli]|uniref:hypothetical protein n=1 Tax=Parafrigoribacterium soli TaxID=3144663 RepID=UPI0032EC2A88